MVGDDRENHHHHMSLYSRKCCQLWCTTNTHISYLESIIHQFIKMMGSRKMQSWMVKVKNCLWCFMWLKATQENKGKFYETSARVGILYHSECQKNKKHVQKMNVAKTKMLWCMIDNTLRYGIGNEFICIKI